MVGINNGFLGWLCPPVSEQYSGALKFDARTSLPRDLRTLYISTQICQPTERKANTPIYLFFSCSHTACRVHGKQARIKPQYLDVITCVFSPNGRRAHYIRPQAEKMLSAWDRSALCGNRGQVPEPVLRGKPTHTKLSEPATEKRRSLLTFFQV